MKIKKALVSVSNDLYTDQRVHKVCMFLHDAGYEVTLIGRLRKSSIELEKRPYRTVRLKLLFEKGPLFYMALNFRLLLYLLTHKSDILVSNDLDTLLANYAVSKFKFRNELYYDTHEIFTEVPELVGKKTVKGIWNGIEAWIVPRLKNLYTVNQNIADHYEAIYHKKFKVVRNISPIWKPAEILTKEELGIPEHCFVVIIQGAGINIDRGAEEMVEAMKQIDQAVLLIVGDGDVVQSLKEIVETSNLNQKVLFFGKKPYDLMMQYTFHADLGITLDKPTNLNYINSLPNKVFDYIHANTPILSSKISQIEQIVIKYDVGKVIEEVNVDEIVKAINTIKSHKELLAMYKANCNLAAEDLSWENEIKVLKAIYQID